MTVFNLYKLFQNQMTMGMWVNPHTILDWVAMLSLRQRWALLIVSSSQTQDYLALVITTMVNLDVKVIVENQVWKIWLNV